MCDLGVCWGDPPDTSTFAAIIIPPANRPDLAPTELLDIGVAPDGTIRGLEFGETVLVHGRVVLGCDSRNEETCDSAPLVPAQVTIERSATFAGGPQYRRTVLTNIEATAEEDSFSLRLPRDGAEYRVTVMPDETSLDTLAQGGTQIQAPPFSTTIRSDDDIEVVWELGRPDQLKSIEGCITSATGNGSNFSGMHVSALGRWTSLSALTRASSIVTTAEDGCFSISVPIGMLDDFDIIARPDPGTTLPTLRLAGEHVRDPDPFEPGEPHVLAPLRMPNAPNPVIFKLPLMGLSSGGALEPVSGASLHFETTFDKLDGEERDIRVRFAAQVTSNGIGEEEPGMATVNLYPGSFDVNRTYNVQVLPPPDSKFASSFDTTIEVGTGEGAPVLSSLDLRRRIAVTGTISRDDSEPLINTPIAVRPSPLLRQELGDSEERNTLDNLQFPSELTGETGDFLLWLDPELLGLMARYDFELAPSDFSAAPRWTFSDLSVGAEEGSLTAVELGTLRLPAASYARGEMRDSEGHLLPGAEIRWFQMPSQDNCPNAAPDEDCDIPARLVGIWESDENGQVVAVLPDP
ncbi:MAG: hypothetical protein GY811_12850 [Myxococcales bacterium]|nr:hypothetical protein [Myxococcales bacterium]